MPITVNVNSATEKQLGALLGLSAAEAKSVASARPFSAVEQFWSALPSRVAQTKPALELAKRDINVVSAEEIAQFAEIPPEVAKNILESRPYYLMDELQAVKGVDGQAFTRLDSVFTVPQFTYTDKLRGAPVALATGVTEVLIQPKATKGFSIKAALPELGLKSSLLRGQDSSYRVYRVPETEEGTNVLVKLKGDHRIDKAVPSFTDASGDLRFLDPEYCVVQFVDGVSPERQEALIKEFGLEIHERHRSPGLLTLRIQESKRQPGSLIRAIQTLNSASEVRFAEPSYLGFDDWENAQLSGLAAGQELDWNLKMIRAEGAWQLGNGSADVIIAIVDSGVDVTHPAISEAILPRTATESWNFESGETPDPVDTEGHGTFIAGLLVGNGTLGIHGLCPGCRILPLKIPTAGGVTNYARRRDAILYVIRQIKPGKRYVMNMSWKTQGDVSMVREAVQTAIASGVVVTSSAGNNCGECQPHYPSDYQSVISVGAVGPDGRKAVYSAYNNRIDFAAPGGVGGGVDPSQNIVSAAIGGGARADAGTSFAAPHLAAVAALMLSQTPTLGVEDIRRIIGASARPVQDAGFGRGLVDMASAVEAARGPKPPAVG